MNRSIFGSIRGAAQRPCERPNRRLFLSLAAALFVALATLATPARAQVFQHHEYERDGCTITAKICNGNPLCTKPVLVGVATYCDPDVSFDPKGVPLPPTWEQLIQQTLYDYKQAWVEPGCCVTLTVKTPKCKDCKWFQVDSFTGCVIKCFAKEGDYPADRLLAGAIFKSCEKCKDDCKVRCDKCHEWDKKCDKCGKEMCHKCHECHKCDKDKGKKCDKNKDEGDCHCGSDCGAAPV